MEAINFNSMMMGTNPMMGMNQMNDMMMFPNNPLMNNLNNVENFKHIIQIINLSDYFLEMNILPMLPYLKMKNIMVSVKN